MIGAPAIAARAAFRAGAGLVKLAVPRDIVAAALCIEPSATAVALAGDAAAQLDAIAAGDPKGDAVLAVGPGLGQGGEVAGVVDGLLRGRRTVVLDADGLNALAATGRPRPGGGPPVLMTPHPGEFRRLAEAVAIDLDAHDPTDPDARPGAAAALARAHDAVVLLKGHRVVVSDGERVYTGPPGNAAFGAAGMGDVLTGLVAALIAQGLGPFDAATVAVEAGVRAVRRWAAAHGPCGMLARDLADGLPDALRELRA